MPDLPAPIVRTIRYPAISFPGSRASLGSYFMACQTGHSTLRSQWHRAAGRLLVALFLVRDLLLCAKYLFIAATRNARRELPRGAPGGPCIPDLLKSAKHLFFATT